MKTLLIVLVSVTLSLGVSAQHGVYYHSYHPRIYVAPFSYGLGFGYPAFGYPYGYPYYGYPYGYPYYGSRPMPYKLSLEIQSIKNDYKSQIREARKDKSLSRPARRKEIRSLKSERDQAIIDAQRNFSRRRNNQTPGTNNNNQHRDNTNSSSGDNSFDEGAKS
jgi:hypothetical protein